MDKRPKIVDIFADIAASSYQRTKGLVEPKPISIPDRVFLLNKLDKTAALKPAEKIDTPSKLKGALDKMRKQYAMFMKNLAPKARNKRKRVFLKEFDWRLEGKEDKKDFSRVLLGKGDWQKVKIPHYGGPIGKAVAYYRREFDLRESMVRTRKLFVCFKGVDYKADVFINGGYVGSHTGFFAPFEFEFTDLAKIGKNVLVVKVYNDAVGVGNKAWDPNDDGLGGDKIYAATGPGYDDPYLGWHHCPPGMGIWQDLYIEARPDIFIYDIFVRPILEESYAEAWIEIYNAGRSPREIKIALSLYGRNFKKTVFENKVFDLQPAGSGLNYYRFSFKIPDVKVWDLKSPWLYELNVKLLDPSERMIDSLNQHFGMRSFKMDESSHPKGRFYLNGRPIKLRGANTMGHMQQCVIRKDWKQLRDDILLAKLCNMNFFRLTQRPVQKEIYDYCDMLGMMTQTDLPLFGVLRRNLFCEAVKQAQEMERLVRSHPCNIMVTYINEPYHPSSCHVKPHRHMDRKELEMFFEAANMAVLQVNPDRVIKPVDGDYDPPSSGLPDNHCYCGWYNGHGVDIGRLHKGYWQKVKPGWYYGCGEFGAEGLDYAHIMRRYYPKEWLPRNKQDEKNWDPTRIPHAQTGKFYYMWFDKADTLEEWVELSQAHQAWASRIMTEAFRRDPRMVSFAIHLFIDAFPSSWMKAIMDFKRNPKPAYFVYRDALSPVMVSLRTDRFKFFAGENIEIELWICNDLAEDLRDLEVHYQLEDDEGRVILADKSGGIRVAAVDSSPIGRIAFNAPSIDRRTKFTLRASLVDRTGCIIHDNTTLLDIFPSAGLIRADLKDCKITAIGDSARGLLRQLGIRPSRLDSKTLPNSILISDYSAYKSSEKEILEWARKGAVVVFYDLPIGRYKIAGSLVDVQELGMKPVHFVSRKTGSKLVSDFEREDFKFWFDEKAGFITPLLHSCFLADGFRPILKTGKVLWAGDSFEALAAAERRLDTGIIRICQLKLKDRVRTNPPAYIFALRLLGIDKTFCL